MLRKIENISPSAEFKNNSRFSSNVGSIPGVVHRKSSMSDSFSFSNAFKFLASLKWNLKSLRKNEKDEFEIEFIIDDFDFITKINPLDLYSKYSLYKIFKFQAGELKLPDFELWLKFIFSQDSIHEKSGDFQPEFLGLISERVKKYSGMLISGKGYESNSILLDGIDSQLISEICFIHSNLIRFIEKATGESLLNPSQNFEKSFSNPLIVEYLNVNF